MKNFAACLVLGALFSTFAENDPFEKCHDFFKASHYEKSVECLNQVLYDTPVSDTARRVGIFERLGTSYTMMDKMSLARSSFDKMVALNPEAELDPLAHHPDVVALFHISKRAYREAHKKQDSLQTQKAYPSALTALPFGIPQWLNGSWKKAVLFGGLQAGALGLSLLAHQGRRALEEPDGTTPQESLPDAQDHAAYQKIGFVLFLGFYGGGLWEGSVNHPKRKRE